MSEQKTAKRTVNGRVISNRMDKTATIAVERLVRHPLYGKYIRRTTKLYAHDEDNRCQPGDWVVVEECRPLSKMKAWKLVEVLNRTAE